MAPAQNPTGKKLPGRGARRGGGDAGSVAPAAPTLDGKPAYTSIEFTLKPGQRIVGAAGAMLWRHGAVAMTGTTGASKGNAIARWVANAPVFMNTFAINGENVTEAKIAFANGLPGDVVELELAVEPEPKYWILSRGCLVCMDEGVLIDSTFRLSGAITGEGAIIPRAWLDAAITTGRRRLWIGGFGAACRHDLVEGQTLLVDNGCFLAANNYWKGSLAANGVFQSLFSGEGFVMEFAGPCVVYTQSRNFDDFANKAVAIGTGGNSVTQGLTKAADAADTAYQISKLFSGGDRRRNGKPPTGQAARRSARKGKDKV